MGWVSGIPIELGGEIDGQETKFHGSAHATTEGHHPDITGGRFPVGGDDQRGCEIPAFFRVVVDEVLQGHLIDRGPTAGTGTSDRPGFTTDFVETQRQLLFWRQPDCH